MPLIEHLIPPASSFARDVDGLIVFIAVLVGFWFFVAQGALFVLIFKYRARPGRKAEYITGNEKHLKRWITFPHALVLVCDVFIITASTQVWYNVKERIPETDYQIRVTGQQWAWTFQDPGPDGELDTADDIRTIDELHLEVDRTYGYVLESKDVLHDFSVPAFRLKQDAVPGRAIHGWFRPTVTGTFDMQCAEICGIGHGIMSARVMVEDSATHAAWVASQASTP